MSSIRTHCKFTDYKIKTGTCCFTFNVLELQLALFWYKLM